MNIWVPRIQILEPRDPAPVIVCRVSGFFSDFVKTLADGRRVPLAGVSANLITNGGLDAMAGLVGVIGFRCEVGTGTAAPAFTDTALTGAVQTQTVQSTTTSQILGTPNLQRSSRVFRFPIGSLNGNYSEIGIRAQLSPNPLFCRALILDGSGNPTTISIASTESLDATYNLDEDFSTGDTAFSQLISGVTYTGFTRRQDLSSSDTNILVSGYFGTFNMTAYSGTLPAWNSASFPGGSLGGSANAGYSTYVSGAYQRSSSYQWGQTVGNGAIKCVRNVFSPVHFGAQYDSAINKNSAQVLTLNFDHVWARA